MKISYRKANIHEERNGYLKREQTKTPSKVQTKTAVPVDAICGLSLLLVLSLAQRGFSPGTPVFYSPQKPTLSNSNSIWNARTRLNEFIWTPMCFVGKQAIYNCFFGIARAWASVILAGKRKMLQVLSFCDRERVWPPLIKITVLTFLVNHKYNEAFRGTYFLRIREKPLSQISYS